MRKCFATGMLALLSPPPASMSDMSGGSTENPVNGAPRDLLNNEGTWNTGMANKAPGVGGLGNGAVNKSMMIGGDTGNGNLNDRALHEIARAG